MADASRLRLGEPGLAPLAGRAGRRPHARPLRRARVRALRPRARRALASRPGSPTSRPSSTPRASIASRCSGSRRARRSRSSTRRGIPSGSAASSSTAATRAAGCGAAHEARAHAEAMASAIRAGWTDANPTFRHLFSMLFLPHGTAEQMAWYDELQRRSTSADDRGAALRGARPDRRGRRGVARDDADAGRARARRTVSSRSRRAGCSPRDPGRAVRPAGVGEPHPALRRAGLERVRGRAPRVPRVAAGARRSRWPAQPARARGARAGRRRADQRGDRRAPVPERPHGRATPLQHLREAARLRQGGPGRRRRAVLRVATCRPPADARRVACWRRCRRGRRARSVAASSRTPPRRRHRDGAHAAASMARSWTSRSRRTTCAAADGLRLHVREWGDPEGPPIVFVHGWSQSQLCWSRQIAGPLADDFRLVTFDLRGHGMSEQPLDAGAYVDARLWADDLNAVIEQLGLERPVLVAWSYGGYVVTDYLAAYGEDGDRRRRPRRRRGAAHADLRAHRAGPARERRRRLRARPADEHRRHPALPARLHGAAAQRPRLEHGAVLEHGRPARGARGAVRARDRRRRRPLPAVRPGAGDPRARRRDRAALDGASTCSTSAARRGPRGTRASATCRSSRTPAASTASSPSSPIRPWPGRS